MIRNANTQPLAGCRILVVDDSAEITSIVADTFATAGAQTVQANTGIDAMRLLTQGGFDLVILDMVMPQPDGWRILRFMHSRTGWLERTIVMTGNRWDPRVGRAVRDYGLAHLFKPFGLPDLLNTACRVLRQVEPMSAA